MRTLVTGADGFVGSWLVPHLVGAGHEVVAAIRPGEQPDEVQRRREHLAGAARVVELELNAPAGWAAAFAAPLDAVVHLAGVSSVSEARQDPGRAWEINAVATVRMAEYLAGDRPGGDPPALLYVSTAEVYGPGPKHPRTETDPTKPVSAYAATKLAAEIGLLEIHRRTGLRVIVARAFPHTGPRQSASFVIPALAQRLLLAKRVGAPAVTVGNLEPVREFLHVADVVEAYRSLLERGTAGEVYNVAGGSAIALRDVFLKLMEAAGYRAVPEVDAALMRAVDVPYLVGEGSKLREATGWTPRISLEQTLADVINAQAN